MRSIINVLLAATMIATSSVPAYSKGEAGQYIFRYKTERMYVDQKPSNPQNKDINAYYVGGIGVEFSEKLPMKAEWQDDDWRVVAGQLPEGIKFDPSTLTFSGTPTSESKGIIVDLEGFDEAGRSIATATAHFDVYALKGIPVSVDFYAHTGKYKAETLAIPSGITVDKWQRVYMPPDGIAVNGPYFEGTPTKAGVYPVFIQGMNYMGEVVATFHGKYTVEDGPTFPLIADKVKPLPQLDNNSHGLFFDFGAPTPHKPIHLIDPARPATYYLELATGEQLPAGITSNGLSKSLNLRGYVLTPYETAKIRFKAIDSDDTIGYSNWFTFGSSDPQPACNPHYGGHPLTVKTGVASTISVPRPVGKQGMVSYHLASGKFPDGLALNGATGRIEGTPTLAGQKTDIDIRVDVTNGDNVVSTNCVYKMEVMAGGTRLVDATPEQQKHIRAGDVYAGTFNIAGGIAPYSVEFKTPSDWPTLAFTSQTQNTPTVSVSGPVSKTGSQTIDFVLSNGDTTTRNGSLNVYSHGPLDTGSVPNVTVQRLASAKPWGVIPYDESTVIPQVDTPLKYPQFTLSNSSGLPSGIKLSGGQFDGSTSAAAGSYGPFTVTMTDFSGQTKTSNPFNVVVTPRDEMAIDSIRPPVFVVRMNTEQAAKPVIEKLPDGAKQFQIDWTMDGGGLPSWIAFDKATGVMTASANMPSEAIGEYGPFTVTATDQEGSTATSGDFMVKISDWPAPTALDVQTVKTNISGDVRSGETQTYVNLAGLKQYILPQSVIGGLNAVTFQSVTPSNPAGLSFDAANGTLYGVPTEEFNGTVDVLFKDGAGRSGVIKVPLVVLPYPAIGTETKQFELPRLANPADANPPIAGRTLRGFWNSARFEWDSASTPLPTGLAVDANGVLSGSTSLPVDTLVEGIRLKAKTTAPDGTTLSAKTPPFSIRIVAPKPFSLSYIPNTATFRLTEGPSGYDLVSKTLPTAKPSGSYVGPLSYSLDQNQAQSEGVGGNLGINAATGALTGMPGSLGKWTVLVGLKDAENRNVSAPAQLTVKATLSGNVERANGGGSPTLRLEQPFRTEPIRVTNVVGTPIFSTIPAMLQSGLVFDATTGAFTEDSAFRQTSTGYGVTVEVKDEDDRTFAITNRPNYRFKVLPPLELSVPAANRTVTATFNSVDGGQPINVAFMPQVTNQIGNVRHDLIGEVPGTLVRKVYDSAGAFLHFAYTDTDGASKHETDAGKLPGDALVFDTIAATLVGTPSKVGTFGGVKLLATDDNQKAYIRSVPTQAEYNSARSEDVTFDVQMNSVIGLDLDRIVIKAGYPFEMQPTVSNESGKVRFYSHAITGELAGQVALNTNTGLVSGTFAVAQDLSFDIYVTDDTARVTSKPVQVKVMPSLRVSVPQAVAFEPGKSATISVATDYVLGTVSYAKGNPSEWPAGMSVDPKTGAVVSDGTTPAGEYPNLYIAATDTFVSVGQTFIDRTNSNTFAVSVNTSGPIIALIGGEIAPWSKRKPGYSQDMNDPAFIAYKHMAQSEIVWSFPTQNSGRRVPPGISISSAGLITGTPAESGTYEFDVQAVQKTNSAIKSVATYRMAIDLLPLTLELADGVLPNAESGKPYSFDFKPLLAFENLPETSITWTKSNVDPDRPLPSGLSLSKSVLSGTPTGADDYEFKVKVSYSNSSPQAERIDDERSYRLYVKKAPPYFTSNITNVSSAVGKSISVTPKMGNKHAEDVYELVGNFPAGLFVSGPVDPDDRSPGLLFDTKTGVISGATRVAGEFPVQIRVTDKLGQKADSNTFIIKLLDSVPTFVGEFVDKTNVDLGVANMPSNTILVYGNTAAAPTTLTLSGGATGHYRRCNSDSQGQIGVCTGNIINAGTISNVTSGTYLQVFVRTASTFDTTVTATLDVGGVERVFNVTTRSSKTEPVNLEGFTPIIGAETLKSYVSNVIKVDGIIDNTKGKLELVEGLGSTNDAEIWLCKPAFADGADCVSGTRGTRSSYATGVEFTITPDSYFQLVTKSSSNFNASTVVRLTVGGVERDFRITTRAANATPKNLGEFIAVPSAELGAIYSSNVIKIGGITDPASAMIELLPGTTSGTLYVCSNSTTGTSGDCHTSNSKWKSTYSPGANFTVTDETYVQIKATASNAYSSTSGVRLTVGGVVREFKITTKTGAADLGGDNEFQNGYDVERSTSVVSNVVQIKGLTGATTATIAAIEGAGTVNAYVCANASSAANKNCYTSTSFYKSQITTTTGRSVSNGDYVQFVATSAAEFDTARIVKLTVNGVDRLWTIKTRKTVTLPKDLGYFANVNASEPNITRASDTIQVSGITDAADITFEAMAGTPNSSYDKLYVCKTVDNATKKDCYYSSTNYRAVVSNGGSLSVNPGEYIQFAVRSENAFAAEKKVKLTIGGVERTWSVKTRDTVTSPSELGIFPNSMSVETSTTVASDVIKIDGITDSTTATVQVIGGTPVAGYDRLYVCKGKAEADAKDCHYSYGNYRTYATTGSSVSIAPGEYIQLTGRSESGYGEEKTIKVTVGGVERTWIIKTRALDITPENLGSFRKVTGAAVNATVTSEAIAVMDIKDTTPITVSVTGSANSTTKVYTCTQAIASSGRCASSSISSGTAGGAAISIVDGNSIALQTRASATPDTEVKVTVSVGTETRTWSVRTAK